MASPLSFHYRSNASNRSLFTIHEEETPASSSYPSPEEVDPHFFQEPLSPLQGPFLLEDGDRCRLYQDEASDWYSEENSNVQDMPFFLRKNIDIVLEDPSNWNPFARWCAAAAIKHYRIWLSLKRRDTARQYRGLMEKLDAALGYYVTSRLIAIPSSHRDELIWLEGKLTRFLFAHERTFVKRAQACNDNLLEQFWDTISAISRLPHEQKNEVEERGSAVIDAVNRQWIDVNFVCHVWSLREKEKYLLDGKKEMIHEIECLTLLSKRHQHGVLSEMSLNQREGLKDETLMDRPGLNVRGQGQENEV